MHRDLKPENVVISYEAPKKIYLTNLKHAITIRELGDAEGLPNNKYCNRRAKWTGGSPNHDLWALGAIVLAWQVGIKTFN